MLFLCLKFMLFSLCFCTHMNYTHIFSSMTYQIMLLYWKKSLFNFCTHNVRHHIFSKH
uniref:Uncharacterized protein n=1 Tax=Papilio xuthus TaxID=66420 RepID=I4DP41_PAPXU|nr:unknown secreted protein [Papilio xuthus]